jgi:glycosyltransferase involved in cell wall biosynthesis
MTPRFQAPLRAEIAHTKAWTPKVLILVSWISRGGGTNLALEVIDGLSRRGVHVIPVVAQLKRGEALPKPSWRCLGFEGDYRNPKAMARAVWRLYRILKDERPNVVQSFMWSADLIGALACALASARHLAYVLDRRDWLTSVRLRHRARRVAAKAIFGLASTRFVAVSESAGQYFEQNLPARPDVWRMARNAVDPGKFRRESPYGSDVQGLRIGTISRLAPEKGVDQLLSAMALLKANRLDVELIVAGDGPERLALIELSKNLGLENAVTFAGDIPSAKTLYEGVDVFAVPSIHSEGLPTTILEAMAMEVPVVATDIGGANEAIIDGLTGRLVQAGSPEKLAEAFLAFATNRESGRAMGIAGRERILQAFTIDRLIDTHATAFADLVKGSW